MTNPTDKIAFDALEAAGRLLDDTLRRVCGNDGEAAAAVRGALAQGAITSLRVQLCASTRLASWHAELTLPSGEVVPLGGQDFEPKALQ